MHVTHFNNMKILMEKNNKHVSGGKTGKYQIDASLPKDVVENVSE